MSGGTATPLWEGLGRRGGAVGDGRVGMQADVVRVPASRSKIVLARAAEGRASFSLRSKLLA